mmetsp:Transcript_31300/g.46707  ORF Transcript_31300/g.46707 Transcript_31300/m.46707 type:complete len:193 (+) Transcript_31300:151-729(+)
MKGKSVSLQDYSRFQYMLAPPWMARPILQQISSVTFFLEPKDPNNAPDEHRLLLTTSWSVSASALCQYYAVCLWVLPSHAMGMSRWIMAKEYPPLAQQHNNFDDDEASLSLSPSSARGVLRHFQYQYYGGFLIVDTYHMRDSTTESSSSFRLVEYFDCNLWVTNFLGGGFYLAVAAAALYPWKVWMQSERTA